MYFISWQTASATAAAALYSYIQIKKNAGKVGSECSVSVWEYKSVVLWMHLLNIIACGRGWLKFLWLNSIKIATYLKEVFVFFYIYIYFCCCFNILCIHMLCVRFDLLYNVFNLFCTLLSMYRCYELFRNYSL